MSKKAKGFDPFDFSYLNPSKLTGWEKRMFNGIIRIIKTFIKSSFSASPTITALFIRKEFGIDYLSLNKLIAANIIIWIFTLLPTPSTGDTYTASPLSSLLAIAVTILSIIHYRETSRNFQQGPVLHSQDTGNSLLAQYLKIDEENTKLYIEPALAILFGVLVIFLGSFTGVLFILGGIAIFLEENQIKNNKIRIFTRINNARQTTPAFKQIKGQGYQTWSKQTRQNQQNNPQQNYQNINTRVAVKPKKKP